MKIMNPPDITFVLAASRFAALGSEQRLLVLRTLVRAGPEGIKIGELGARTGISGSTLTHHVKILTQAGLVHQAKVGRSVICAAIAYEDLKALADFLLENCCADVGCAHETEPHHG